MHLGRISQVCSLPRVQFAPFTLLTFFRHHVCQAVYFASTRGYSSARLWIKTTLAMWCFHAMLLLYCSYVNADCRHTVSLDSMLLLVQIIIFLPVPCIHNAQYNIFKPSIPLIYHGLNNMLHELGDCRAQQLQH